MIRSLIKLGLILVVGILIYNYFLGTPEEKETSKTIFREVKELGQATWSLLRSEKEKFDEGKYDEAIDKVGSLYNRLRGHAETIRDADLINRVEELDQRREAIRRQLETAEKSNGNLSAAERDALRRDWSELMTETEDLMQDLEEKK